MVQGDSGWAREGSVGLKVALSRDINPLGALWSRTTRDMLSVPISPTRQPTGPGWSVALAVILGLSATGLASYILDREGRRLDADRFSASTHQILQEIQTRIEAYERGLATLQVFFSDIPRPSEVLWKSRLRLLDPTVNFDALLEIGYAEFVSAGPTSALSPTLPDHLAWMRQKAGADYRILPTREVPYFFPVTHMWAAVGLEPVPLGLDLGTAARQIDLLLATFSAGAVRSTVADQALSLRAGAVVPGFRLYLPVYSGRDPFGLNSPNARVEAAQGLIFATIDVDRLLKGIFEDRTMDVAVDLFDGPDPGQAHRLNLETRGLQPGTHQDPSPTGHQQVRIMAHYGEKWSLRFHSLPAFELRSPRRQAMTVAIAGALLSILLAGIVWFQARARRIQECISAELSRSREQLRLALEERERFSRDLHDGTIQSIYGLGLQLEHIRKLLSEAPAEAAEELVAARDEINEIILDLRRFLLSLEPEIIRGRRLDEALEALVVRMQRTTHVRLTLETDRDACGGMPPEQAIHLLNITREAVTNSLRHASPTHVRVGLEFRDGRLLLIVEDDGSGFDPMNHAASGEGLRNMQIRSQALGATFQLESHVGRGTRLMVRWSGIQGNSSMELLPTDLPVEALTTSRLGTSARSG